MRRRVIVAGAVAAVVAVVVCAAWLRRHRLAEASRGAADTRAAAATSARDGSAAEDPGARPPTSVPGRADVQDVRAAFDRCLQRLRLKIDHEGLILSPAAFDDEIRFMKEHGAQFRDEIRRICLERGFSPATDQLASVLAFGLTDDEQRELAAGAEQRITDLLAAHGGRKLSRGQALVQIIGDPAQPIGTRTQAVWLLTSTPGDEWSQPALVGPVLSLLQTVREPLLRTWLFSQCLGAKGDPTASAQVLECALSSFASDDEKPGTLEVIASRLGSHLASGELGERFGARIEEVLVSRLAKEAADAEPDDLLLSRISSSMLGRRGTATPDQVAQASALLRSHGRFSVREAALSMLLPDAARPRSGQPDVLTHIARCRPVLLDALGAEQNERLAAMIVRGTSRWRDPETNGLLREMSKTRPDLRAMIDDQLRKNAPK